MSSDPSSTVTITLTQHASNTGRNTDVHPHGDAVKTKGDWKSKTYRCECICAQA